MSPLQALKSILDDSYQSDDGEIFGVTPASPLSQEELNALSEHLPGNHLPAEIEELLRFTRGFDFWVPERIDFTAFGQFGMEEVFPNSVNLAGDGFGNYWILDVDSAGNWGAVYYACHDPAVIVKHSENLAQFIQHIGEFGKKGAESHLDVVHEKTVMDIWGKKFEPWVKNPDVSAFSNLDDSLLPDKFFVADLRNADIGSGFPWGKFSPDSKILRLGDEALWIVERKERKGLFAKLFGK